MLLNLASVEDTPRHITVKAPMTKYVATIHHVCGYVCLICYALQLMKIVLNIQSNKLLPANPSNDRF